MSRRFVTRLMTEFQARDPRWMAAAVRMLMRYPHRRFIASEIRTYASQNGLRCPPGSPRIWGAVMKQAERQGLIRRCGQRRKYERNGSMLVVLWEKVQEESAA